jgi:uncharacterized membrane protein
VVIFYKLVWGISECIIGLVLLTSRGFINKELSEDPQDIFANWALNQIHLNPTTTRNFGILMIILGIAKILIAAGVWHSSWKMRHFLMWFLSIITLYALGDILIHYSDLRLFTLCSDLAILFYLWKILPSHIRHHEAHPTIGALDNF